jgi:hypothetical protein
MGEKISQHETQLGATCQQGVRQLGTRVEMGKVTSIKGE